MTVNLTKLVNCRACGSQKLNKVIDFKATGIADDYFKKSGNECSYPLTCLLCNECNLLQLEYIVDASAIYDDYIYVSSSSPGLDRHFKEYAQVSAKQLSLSNESKALDIGCNDGMLLKHYQSLGFYVVGVEPSKPIAQSLNDYGIKTYNSYLNDEVVERIVSENGLFNLVTSNNVFANVNNINEFAKSAISLLDNNGVWIIETGYHLSLIENFVFDNIYHEHLSYFSVSAFKKFFSAHGLELFHVEKIESKGGSIRVYAGLKSHARKIEPSVNKYIQHEKDFGLFELTTYETYTKRINNLRKQVNQELSLLEQQGKKIIGFGASATVTTVISVLGLADFFDCLIDDNLIKQGTYSPEYRIPVLSSDVLNDYPQSCVVILPWRFADMFIEKNNHHLQRGGTFLKLIPIVEHIKS